MTRNALILVLTVLTVLAGCSGGSSSPPNNGTNPPPAPLPTGGLDQRPTNLSCVAPTHSGGAGGSIAINRVFTNLSFNQPLAMLQAPGDATRWFVVERPGIVSLFANDPNAAGTQTFIDIQSRVDSGPGEAGLLGMAFHPNFSTNHEVFLSYTAPGLVSVVSRFISLDGGVTLDPGSEQVIIRLNQDFGNHNGGNIAFGPDGFLYIGFGDGGSGGDPDSRAQNTSNLLGAMLRLDVDGGTPYAIPSSNPFAGGAMCSADPNVSAGACPEIYAWGLRNPWRWSFDSVTGELWAGDVGQSAWEEVDRIELGGNYGWDCREGTSIFASPAASCSTASGLVDPVHEYSHSLGNSITGGYVYRGAALGALQGDYLYADFGSGRIWRLMDDGAGGLTDEELLDTNLGISSFGAANDGELYVIDLFTGNLYQIVDGGTPVPGPPVPDLLSATGCVSAQNPSLPAAGLIPYEISAPFWSDGADKQRWLAIPDGTTIAVGTDGDFSFPSGTVLMKHFRLSGSLIETRLFMRHPDGDWAGYSYEWDAQQVDATLVSGGKVATIAGQDWIFPSGNQCLICHTAAAGFSLGPESAQLNHDFTYPSTGRSANQLETLDEILLFSSPLGDAGLQATIADPADTNASLDQRARAYLHTNCAQCHRSNGPTPSSMDLLFNTDLASTNACDAVPQSGDLGIGANARIIAAGDPTDSVLLARMDRRDANAMPPLATNLVDTAGVTLIRDWIANIQTCL